MPLSNKRLQFLSLAFPNQMVVKEKINILYTSAATEAENAISTSAWVRQFSKVLEIRLEQLSDKQFIIQTFSSQKLLKFNSAGIVVIIGNQSFLEFIQKQKLLSKLQNTLIKPHVIIQNPTDFEAIQAFLNRTKVYKFYKLDIQTEQIKLFGLTEKEELKNAFWGKLDDLARDLANRLGNSDENTTSKTTSKQPIYLAEVDDTATEYRAKIKRELQEYGYRILPQRALPIDLKAYKAKVIELLKQCEISIHIFGETYGFVPKGGKKSASHVQNEIAAEKSKTQNLKRLLWIPSQTKPDDEFQEDLLEYLKNDPQAQEGGELFETTLEEFKFAIHQKLEDNTVLNKSITNSQSLYIICDSADEKELQIFQNELKKRGWVIHIPLRIGNEYEVRMHHLSCLKSCESALIYYSHGSPKWLEASLKDLVKVAGYGRTKPWRQQIVYYKKPIKHNQFYIDTIESINAKNTPLKQLLKRLV